MPCENESRIDIQQHFKLVFLQVKIFPIAKQSLQVIEIKLIH